MKSKITILMIILFSNLVGAQNNYDTLWTKVSDFEVKGLPKSALAEVENIYTLAKKEENSPQIIKCILFRSKFALTLEEDAQLKIITSIKEEIAHAKAPEKNILESILANIYWQYFQQNRYKFYNRTHTAEKVDENDFRTWDLHTIFSEIHVHHQNALQNALTLQDTKLSEFDAILHKQDGSEKYRPTVYDFIAHNALDFYKTGESNLAQPAYKFEIEQPAFLGDNTEFINADFTSKDSLSQKLNALKIYKNLSLFHRKDKDKTALIANVLERLDFVNQHAVFPEKETVYFETLNKIQKEYREHEISTEIDYRIALYYQKLASTYNRENTEHQFKLRKAIEICELAKYKFPESKGAVKCENLKEQILAPNIHLTNETHIPTQKESRLLVRYKNSDHIYFKLFSVTTKDQNKINRLYNNKEKLDYIKNLTEVTTFNNKLKNESDFQTHTTEVILPKLDQGIYLILASGNQNFNEDSFAYNYVNVTDIALVESKQNELHKYQVVNRNTGNPLAGARVHFENFNTSRYNKKINKTLVSDVNGFVSLSTKNDHRQIEINITHNEDEGLFKYYYINKHYRYNDREYKRNSIFLFTDRSIYRPGQIAYFKGIAVKQLEGRSEVLPNKSVLVSLQDVNGQQVSTLEVKTNEFGSFNGEFILPGSGLTGHFSIQAQGVQNFIDKLPFSGNKYMHGSVGFSVEEYKRPKFSAKFDPVKETFKLNDSIKISGIASAYSRSDITDAKVVYRVKRKVQYPRWWYWYRPYGFNSEAQEITHGETKTDKNGVFEITFLAQPDKSVSKNNLPVFHYEITADITDINGETRSANTTVKVGYHALTVEIGVENTLEKNNKENKLTLTTNNLNGEFVPAKGTLKIYKVKVPKNVLRNRPWQAPDYQEIDKRTFEKLFPHDTYKTSKEIEKRELVLERSFDTQKSKEIALKKMRSWESGKYVAIVESKDKFDQEVTDKVQFEVFSEKDRTVTDNQLFTIRTDKEKYQPGDVLKLTIGTASKDMTVVVNIEKDRKVIRTEAIHLNNEIKEINVPVTKEDLGGFSINYHFVNYNSYEQGSLTMAVPYPKTELDIETVTFRDKLQSGQEETWSFKIKGTKKDAAVAEILSSMYDASLDQFKGHQWQFNPIYRKYYYPITRNSARNFGKNNFRVYQKPISYRSIPNQYYDRLNWFGFHFGYGNISRLLEGKVAGVQIMEDSAKLDEVVIRGMRSKKAKKVLGYANASAPVEAEELENSEDGIIGGLDDSIDQGEKQTKNPDLGSIKTRTNFKETAFFFPDLRTDEQGNVSFSFTTPESLTQWKLQLLGHTKELHSAVKSLETVTQKELMVLPNPPRFLRQGDEIVISTKIANLTDKELNGHAALQLVDAITNKPIDVDLKNNDKTQSFTVEAKGNTNINWTLHIPYNIQAVQYKIVAKAGNYSDGEQNVLPVLTNRMLVTETLPMWVRSNETRTFTLDKLKNTRSDSRKNHKLTLEVTSNPAWYAVQALPYLMEYPYECAEQTFSRYYANSLASHIANSNPRIQQVFEQWKNTDALLSNLEKNQELKSIIIQETPWLRDAQSETEQKKRIALLFDLNKMKNQQEKALRKLKHMQMSSGGFPWFKGSRYENRYITQHIVAGLGHLKKLGVKSSESLRAESRSENELVEKAITYLDNQILKDYNHLLDRAERLFANEKDKEQKIKKYLADNHTSHFQAHYLYTRSFYKEHKVSDQVKTAFDYYTQQSYSYWMDYNLYTKGLIALSAHRDDQNIVAKDILMSLKENAITNEELGMYWKENVSSYYWYQAPIETQALMIEVFTEVGAAVVVNKEKNLEDIDNLKIWLLKNKQTNRWKTTKATTEAVYALLLQGTDWLETTEFVDITIGDTEIDPLALEDTKVEAGTGYYKTSWNTKEIEPAMAEVTIKKDNEGIAWGALYWQYFEDLDKITPAKTPLQLSKKLFLKTNEDRGEKITEISDTTALSLGDLVRVRIELKVDRAMEFIHLKDMRASGFEPVNVLSRYKWQDGLGYYESTKDAATNFFIDYLPKGVYVFEYDLRVNNKGDFSNGITTIQSMYAPEFSSHSEGIRVKVN